MSLAEFLSVIFLSGIFLSGILLIYHLRFFFFFLQYFKHFFRSTNIDLNVIISKQNKLTHDKKTMKKNHN